MQERLRSAAPDDTQKPNFYFRLGESYAQQGRVLDAEKNYVEASKFPQYCRRDEVLFRLASQPLRSKGDDLTREYFHRITKDYPQSVSSVTKVTSPSPGAVTRVMTPRRWRQQPSQRVLSRTREGMSWASPPDSSR